VLVRGKFSTASRLRPLCLSELCVYESWFLTRCHTLVQKIDVAWSRLIARRLPIISNQFYADKLANCPKRLDHLDQLQELPLTEKEELIREGSSQPTPVNLTWPLQQYVRYHQTSGTHGRPLPVYDTAADWQWWIDGWQFVLDAADITSNDRALLAFSFGPFIGFWSAHDALIERGGLAIPGGGMNSLARLDLIRRIGVTVLFCTPTYALHLAEVAEENKINLAHFDVRKIVVAGETGGSVPATRARIPTTVGPAR